MVKFLDLSDQYQRIKNEVDAAIQGVIENTAFIGGEQVATFESKFAKYQQAKKCVGVGNGTDALEIAIEALDLPKNSEIIVPANSFIASSEAVTRSGHKVVFADIDANTLLVDLKDLEKRITPATSALMVVHLYGQPCDMAAVRSIADQHNLKIIEDCAQAHGAEFQGTRVGAIGDIGTFSFYPGKNLGAYGDGGAIVTNNEELAKKCRMIANHGRTKKYDHDFEGRNSRLDGLQAAILNVKLDHLDDWTNHRNQVASQYLEGLANIEGLKLPTIAANVKSAFHLFVVQCDQRDQLADHLKANGVQCGMHYPISLPRLEAYGYLGQDDTPIANAMCDSVLSLPMGDHLTSEDITTVINTVRSFFSK